MASNSLKHIVVTGGNKGIGKAICKRLVSEYQDTYVILGSRDEQRGQQAIQDIVKECGGNDTVEKRLQCLEIDVSDDDSVAAAASKIEQQFGPTLYGIINNAGIAWEHATPDIVNTNYFGTRRVNEKIGKFVKHPGGRIVNIASASGPNFLSSLPDGNALKEKLMKPWTIKGGVSELDEIAREYMSKVDSDGYGFSKALVNAYTVLHGKAMQKDGLIVNSCTPGWILTDMTRGTGAKNAPDQGAVPPCYLLMDAKFDTEPAGRYYGSDCIRSPMHYYRGPGDDPYVNDEDLDVVVPSLTAQQ